MIELSYIRNFYPPSITGNPNLARHLVKEYVELMAMDYLSTTDHITNLSFIGGTNLRLVKGLDRFSEDLDFDCKNLTAEEFKIITDDLIAFFRESGLQADARDRENLKLSAYRRSIHFPELLFDLGLTAHREQKFLLKMEAQDQGVAYKQRMAQVARCGFTFQVPTPPDGVLLSMKLSALLTRAKGRDFYDTMFLWQMTDPDYGFLSRRVDIHDKPSLLAALRSKLDEVDLALKAKDFEHLLFNPENAKKILHFPDFLQTR